MKKRQRCDKIISEYAPYRVIFGLKTGFYDEEGERTMRNLNKFLALVMAVLMLFGMAVIPMSAVNEDDADSIYYEAAQQLAALTIMKGDENGDLNLANGVTRYQAALFFVQALTGKTDVKVWNAEKKSTIFADVPEYGTAIDYAYSMKLILGRGDGSYGYHDPITYQDMLVMAVRALGYEESGMAYPNGYVLRAQTLGLTDNIETVNFKGELTRGETAQIIWDMLNTQIAFIDPMTNAVILPGQEDFSPYGMLVGPGKIERTTLLEKAGYANGKLEATILSFNEAYDEDDVDTVEIEYTYLKDDSTYTDSVEVAAADLGITADTPKIEYLGLPLTLYVNCAAEDFASEYSIDEDEREASVVFTNREALSTVENLGDAGNIRYIDDKNGSIQLGGTKYSLDKYDLCVYTLDEDGWVESAEAQSDFLDNFLYKTKGGYEDALNSYGAVRYIVRNGEKDENKTLHIYYTPYEFGQYFVRELRDSGTRKDTDFVTIGTYSDTAKTNQDDVSSHFVEKLLGTNVDVTASTTSVSTRNGEKAKTVELAGKSIRNGNFMFYFYNSVDNILNVVENCGSFKTGRLTGTSASNQTLKIDGTNMSVGFKGAYISDMPGYDHALVGDIIELLESGKDNVKYIEADGRVVYYEAYSTAKVVSKFDYAIISIDEEPLAGLLGLSKKNFRNALTSDGLYLDDDGIAIAVMDTETGKWKLAHLRYMEAGAYDEDDDSFDVRGDMPVLAEYADTLGSFAKRDDYDTLYDALTSDSIFVVRSQKNGVYNLAEWKPADDLLTYGKGKDGIVFSTAANKTNLITADSDKAAARVTLNSDTVIVVVSGSRVGVRIGKQNTSASVEYAGKFLSANSDLIVFVTDSATAFNPETWGQATTADEDKSWYMATADTDVDLERLSSSSHRVTVTNVLNLRTMKIEKSLIYTVESSKDAPTSLDVGDVIYMNSTGDGELYDDGLQEAFIEAVKANGAEDSKTYTELDVSKVEFIDDSTIRIDELDLDGIAAVDEINVTVLTLDLTGFDWDIYDYDNMALDIPFDEEDDLGYEHAFGDKYAYTVEGDMVEEISSPSGGVLDQLIILSDGETILVPEYDADDFKGAEKATVEITMLANVSDGVVTLYVLKVLLPL